MSIQMGLIGENLMADTMGKEDHLRE